MRTACFTGRRAKTLCGYDGEKYTSFHNQLVEYLETLYTEGIREFISGGAQGFDQLAFWAVNELKQRHNDIKNTVYIPFRGQESRWAAHGMFSREDYNLMLTKADEIKYLKEINTSDYNQVVKALYDRNHSMVNNSELCIALYPSDDWRTSKGGTAECIRYARNKNIETRQIRYTINNNGLSISETITI